MQWTHFPPFLKWGQITSGYLLELEILLVFKDENCDCWAEDWAEDLTEKANKSCYLKPVF